MMLKRYPWRNCCRGTPEGIYLFTPGPEQADEGHTWYRVCPYPRLLCLFEKDFEKNGIDIAVLGNYLNLLNPSEEYLKDAYEKYYAHIRFASLLGCGMVGTETGAPMKHTSSARSAEMKRRFPCLSGG